MVKKINLKPLFDSATWNAVGETVNVLFIWMFQILLLVLAGMYVFEGWQSTGRARWELTAHAAAVLLIAFLFKRYVYWNPPQGGENPHEGK